jgi:glycerophosphoryl diester phosphodiesterase
MTNYEKGFRLFELDLMMTADGHLAGIHDGQQKDYGLSESFSKDEFKSRSLMGTTPLVDLDIAELARTKHDWLLVTDIKTDNIKGLSVLSRIFESQNIPCADRIIPQIYDPQELGPISTLGFKRVIFTLYRYGNRRDEVIAFLDKNPSVWAVTMWADWWDANYAKALKERNVLGFVHTVNDKERAAQLFRDGVAGIYTDFLGPKIL